MRTTQEIVDRILSQGERDPLGFGTNDLLVHLDFDSARQFLNPEEIDADTKRKWNEVIPPRDAPFVRQLILDYMPFAWEKANNCRGLSALRSMCHMSVWLWMLEEDSVSDKLTNYTHFGKPFLRAICEHFGRDWTAWDNGQWKNDEFDDGVPPDTVAKVSLNWKEA